MKRKFRLILYVVVGIPIPLLSQLMYPELPIWEPLSFTGLVVVLGLIIEINAIKNKLD